MYSDISVLVEVPSSVKKSVLSKYDTKVISQWLFVLLTFIFWLCSADLLLLDFLSFLTFCPFVFFLFRLYVLFTFCLWFSFFFTFWQFNFSVFTFCLLTLCPFGFLYFNFSASWLFVQLFGNFTFYLLMFRSFWLLSFDLPLCWPFTCGLLKILTSCFWRNVRWLIILLPFIIWLFVRNP